jgi:hypothetical protein
LRDARVALALLSDSPSDSTIGELQIGPIEWWLDWLLEEKDARSAFWLRYRVALVFSKCLSADTRQAFVTEFNWSGSKFRKLLARFILPYWSEVTTDLFSEDAISFLLADLNRDGSTTGFGGHLLGASATEKFVSERLLSLLPDAKPPLSENLRKVLTQAGSRHRRRYVAT